LREREREREKEKGEDLMKNLRSGNPNGEGRRGIPLLDDDKKSLYLVD
jgi:hypothetical protein